MVIQGHLVVLRDEKHASDDEDLFRWLNMEEWQYYDEPDQPFLPVSRDTFKAKSKQPRKQIPNSHTWQIDTIEGLHLGWVIYYQLDETTKSTYIGIDLPNPESWGKGYGKEALSLLINFLLAEVGLKKIKITTWTGNIRMKSLAKKCGFIEIGRSPHRVPISVRGEPLEFIHYCIFSANYENKA